MKNLLAILVIALAFFLGRYFNGVETIEFTDGMECNEVEKSTYVKNDCVAVNYNAPIIKHQNSFQQDLHTSNSSRITVETSNSCDNSSDSDMSNSEHVHSGSKATNNKDSLHDLKNRLSSIYDAWTVMAATSTSADHSPDLQHHLRERPTTPCRRRSGRISKHC